jgi:hypothetical protein
MGGKDRALGDLARLLFFRQGGARKRGFPFGAQPQSQDATEQRAAFYN